MSRNWHFRDFEEILYSISNIIEHKCLLLIKSIFFGKHPGYMNSAELSVSVIRSSIFTSQTPIVSKEMSSRAVLTIFSASSTGSPKKTPGGSGSGSGRGSAWPLPMPLVAQDSTSAASRHKLVLVARLPLFVIPLYLSCSLWKREEKRARTEDKDNIDN